VPHPQPPGGTARHPMQDFTVYTSGNLKTWKPVMFHGLEAARIQIARNPVFHRHRGRASLPMAPDRRSGRFLHGLVDQIRRTGRGLLQGGRGQVRVALGHLGI
jgi:hypothetical protein